MTLTSVTSPDTLARWRVAGRSLHTGYTLSPVNQATHRTLVTLEAGGGQIVARGRNVFGVSQPSPAQPSLGGGTDIAQPSGRQQQLSSSQLTPS